MSYKPHGRLGGTAIAALMGDDSFGRKPIDIYRAIVDGVRSPQNRYMARGNAMEPRIRELYVTETGAVLQTHPGVVHWRDAFAASVDDIRERGGVVGPVDYKSASANSMRKWASGMLASYAWQLRLYMAVFAAPAADLFVAFGKDRDATENEPGAFVLPDGSWAAFDVLETRTYTVTRDLEVEAHMIDVGERFWADHIIPRCPPDGPPVPAAQRLVDTALSPLDLSALSTL